MKACQILLDRLAPVKASMENPTWAQLIQEAYNRDLNLTAQYTYISPNCKTFVLTAFWCEIHRFSKNAPDVKDYNIWAVCISEVEVDILTGEKQVWHGLDIPILFYHFKFQAEQQRVSHYEFQ
jgi:xanthine dehydrogenase molybdopterin-binding subunit B